MEAAGSDEEVDLVGTSEGRGGVTREVVAEELPVEGFPGVPAVVVAETVMVCGNMCVVPDGLFVIPVVLLPV